MENKGYIVINLLPYRDKLKKQKLQRFIGIVAVFALAALGVIILGSAYLSVKQSEQESRNKFIEKANVQLDEQIAEIATLRETIAETLAKRRVVESLQVNRSDAVNILNELSIQMPEGMKLMSVIQKGNRLTIVGKTSSNSKVSTYMSALEDTPVFKDAQITEIKRLQPKVSTVKGRNNTSDFTFVESQFTLTVEMEKDLVVVEEPKKTKKK